MNKKKHQSVAWKKNEKLMMKNYIHNTNTWHVINSFIEQEIECEENKMKSFPFLAIEIHW